MQTSRPASNDDIVSNMDLTQLRTENQQLRAHIEELRQKLKVAESLADTDTLTPLPNRRRFERALAHQIARAARYEVNAAVMFVDVDGLKAINDSYGHCAGDRLLIHIGELLCSILRATDLVARIGGDEFGLLIEPIDEANIGAKMNMLAALINDRPLQYQEHLLRAQVSIGYTMLGPKDDIEAVLRRADADMYRAKRAHGHDQKTRI